jgi:hypothetical protein
MPIAAAKVIEWVPEPVRPWVRRMTEEGIAWMTELADAEPAFLDAANRLKVELAALE